MRLLKESCLHFFIISEVFEDSNKLMNIFYYDAARVDEWASCIEYM